MGLTESYFDIDKWEIPMEACGTLDQVRMEQKKPRQNLRVKSTNQLNTQWRIRNDIKQQILSLNN